MIINIKIIFISLTILGILIVLYSLVIAKIILRPNKPTVKKAYDIEVRCNGIEKDWLNNNPSDSFLLHINSKHCLKGNIFYCKKPSDNYVIALHGWAYNRTGMLKYVDMLLDAGFNVVLYDHRGLGESSGRIVTLGNREKDDLRFVIDYIRNKHNVNILGLIGVSMGASTSLLYQQKYQDADFIIAECGYASLKRLIKEVLEDKYHLPSFNLFLVEIILLLFGGFTYKKVSPIDYMDKVNCPVLFIHGLNDRFISCHHSIDMFNRHSGIKEIILIKGGVHAGSVLTYKIRYQAAVNNFINKIKTTG